MRAFELGGVCVKFKSRNVGVFKSGLFATIGSIISKIANKVSKNSRTRYTRKRSTLVVSFFCALFGFSSEIF